jgi:hypothetical protein
VHGETRPSPPVFQLVEIVLRVPAVRLMLCDCPYLVYQRCHERGILIEYPPLCRFGQIQGQLFGGRLFGCLLVTPSRLALSPSLQFRVQTLSLLSSIHPWSFANSFAISFFTSARFPIPSQKLQLARAQRLVKQWPLFGLRILCGCLIPSLYFHVHHHT